MVAPIHTLNDADKAADFTKPIQGHVSNQVEQEFNIERERTLFCKDLNLPAREIIAKDQFGNLYVIVTAKLLDEEVWAVTSWVGAEKWTGTEKSIVLVKEYKKFGTFSDQLLAYIQGQAFVSLGTANLAIIKARHAAALPTEIDSNQSIRQ